MTLVNKKGVPLDMGTAPLYMGVESATYYKGITEKQNINRQILATAMMCAGFNNYPAEWWHWSYGDRMWAAYRNKKFALYGEADSPEYVLTDKEKSALA